MLCKHGGEAEPASGAAFKTAQELEAIPKKQAFEAN
jgi:hypothetical protein